MKVLMNGTSGFIGKQLQNYLKTCGHQVMRLVRDQSEMGNDAILWDPVANKLDLSSIEGFDSVINLAGENIAGARWTKAKKQRILDSRIQSTSTMSKALAKLSHPPQSFICASAVGIYGNRGQEWCNEDSTRGTGFLADVCSQWEAAASPAIEKGIRTVFLRFGVVLSARGGALGKLVLPFKFGLGGALGSGQQYMSWIAMDDLVAIVLYAMTNQSLKGPINTVSPGPVTNAEFTNTLGRVLNRPTFFATPEFALKAFLGKEMAEELLLSSTRVAPLRLTQAGYSFLYPELDGALKHLLK